MSHTAAGQFRALPIGLPSRAAGTTLPPAAPSVADVQAAGSNAWLAAEALQDEVLRFLTRRLFQQHAVEDVLQGFYLRVFENAHLLKDDRSVRSWLYRILRSSLVDYVRANARQCDIAERLGSRIPPFVPDFAFLDLTCTDMLDDLKPEYRDILVRMRLRGDTADEAAADLRTTPNNIRVRHFRARAALRRAYTRKNPRERGYDFEAWDLSERVALSRANRSNCAPSAFGENRR